MEIDVAKVTNEKKSSQVMMLHDEDADDSEKNFDFEKKILILKKKNFDFEKKSKKIEQDTLKKGDVEIFQHIEPIEIGKLMQQFSLKHANGYCFIYVNNSSTHRLIEKIKFELHNLKVINHQEKNQMIKLTILPQQKQVIHLQTIDKTKGFSLEMATATKIKVKK